MINEYYCIMYRKPMIRRSIAKKCMCNYFPSTPYETIQTKKMMQKMLSWKMMSIMTRKKVKKNNKYTRKLN